MLISWKRKPGQNAAPEQWMLLIKLWAEVPVKFVHDMSESWSCERQAVIVSQRSPLRIG